ncbi:MAG: hypothetical protein ACPGNV_15105 [Mangrovicoccus sp.]
MPNLKLFVDRSAPASANLGETLGPLRDLLCQKLDVPPAACQLAVVEVIGLADQPQINAELHIMPGPARTRELLSSLATEIQSVLAEFCDVSVAVRIAQLDPETYVALK